MREGAYPNKNKKSVAGQFAVKHRSETYCWTQKLSREDYGVDKYCGYIFFLSRLRFEISRLRLQKIVLTLNDFLQRCRRSVQDSV